MSEDETKPLLEAILKEVRDGFAASDRRFAAIERQLERMDIRLDEISSFAHQTRSEILALRASFKAARIEDEGEEAGLVRG